MKTRASVRAQITHNKKVHDAVALAYEAIHVEIYNPTEQARIARVLSGAIAELSESTGCLTVLDFGAGTGNLTAHFLAMGAWVCAGDVSPNSLSALRAKYPDSGCLKTAELNGVDLSEFSDNTFDVVATHSVLHHVPDYLTAVREFVRVVRPGGVIYIDHEVAPVFWARQDDGYAHYQAALRRAYGPSTMEQILKKVRNLWSLSAWKRVVNRRLFGLHEEGDIHVKREDHIEWALIENILAADCEIKVCEDYLVCRELSADRPIHRQFEKRCVDMRVVVAKKRM